MVCFHLQPNTPNGMLPFREKVVPFSPFYVLRFMKFLQLRSIWNRVDHMWSGALGYSVIWDDWKSALQFRKKEKRTRKMPEGFQTTSFPRKRRWISADSIQAEIDSILSFLYSIKTSKVKIKRGDRYWTKAVTHIHTACGWWSTIRGLPKMILCEIRQEESRQTNKQTHTVGVDFERGGSYRIWLNCVDKRNGQFEGVVSPLGGTSGGSSTWAVEKREEK